VDAQMDAQKRLSRCVGRRERTQQENRVQLLMSRWKKRDETGFIHIIFFLSDTLVWCNDLYFFK
jgi:hypothetical protein